jgi:hypothetical protein
MDRNQDPLKRLTEQFARMPIRRLSLKDRLKQSFDEFRWGQKDRADHLKKLSAAVLLLLVIGCLVAAFSHFGECRFARVEITPDPQTTTILHLTRHHWFGRDEEIILTAQPIDGQKQWCVKATNGEWWPFFAYRDRILEGSSSE